MNIHEHQAKQILKKYGVAVPNGVFGHTVEELIEKSKSLKTEKYILNYSGIKFWGRIKQHDTLNKEVVLGYKSEFARL